MREAKKHQHAKIAAVRTVFYMFITITNAILARDDFQRMSSILNSFVCKGGIYHFMSQINSSLYNLE